MAKIFRLHNTGNNTYQGWNSTPAFPYNQAARDSIADPDGATATNEITSIPSPFARIDLVKTAFKEVCKLARQNIQQLKGDTIFHKMVSDSLDIAEIFFNISKMQDKVEIITCDIHEVINTLNTDNNPYHQYLADALNKYLLSDGATYNFNNLKNIYLLNYRQGPDQLNIIGATSPATLFFCGANDLSYVNDLFFANNHRAFDGTYTPLHDRDFEYVKAWWALKVSVPMFSVLFPEVDDYLNLTYREIAAHNQINKNALDQINPTVIGTQFEPITVQNGNQNNLVEVLGHNLLKKKAVVNPVNDFTINATVEQQGTLPLVLPVTSGNTYANLQYISGTWGSQNRAPYMDKNDLAVRTLPFDGSKAPYLTISDFLEDTMVEVPHTINSKYYFDGRMGEKELESFLIPVKPLYFKYFTVEDLVRDLTMQPLAGGSVCVALNIPIRGNGNVSSIKYERIYYAKQRPNISADKNEGGMTKIDFSGMVMPGRRFQRDEEAMYTVACVTAYSTQVKFSFYKQSTVIGDITPECRNTTGVEIYKADIYTLTGNNFDYIQVAENNVKGIIVPIFREHNNTNSFEFAVDLGTSNTHIELKQTGDAISQPLEYKESGGLQAALFNTTYQEVDGNKTPLDLNDENKLLAVDIIPSSVGKKHDFSFPARTAMSCAKIINWNQGQRPFAMCNMLLTYGKRTGMQYNSEPLVNIKWNTNANAQQTMETYINNLMLMIRNKVVVNDGDIAHTKVTWFYPDSMSPNRRAQLNQAWNDAYARMFSPNGQAEKLSESVAPIRYYFSTNAAVNRLVNIDIGGGTTDIAFSSNGAIDYITSFKIATNALFENSLVTDTRNGIIDFFKEGQIRNVLNTNQYDELNKIFLGLQAQPANMASFLFSLKKNKKLTEVSDNVKDFDKILQNDNKFKIIFVIFYTAIIYHIAKIVKAKGMDMPDHIAFSGNGSKIIKVLSSDTEIIEKYTKLVFENVLGSQHRSTISILGLDRGASPKEATCKGGLVTNKHAGQPEVLVLKDSSGNLADDTFTYNNFNDSDKEKIVTSVKEFFKFVLVEMPRKIDFNEYFGLDLVTLDIAREVYNQHLESYLERGINISKQETQNPDTQIVDVLSFYPIKGVIQDLSLEIQRHYTTNNTNN